MEKKKDIDIVDRIIDRLKSNEELPYREGAWERFRSSKLKKKWDYAPMWAVATLCLLGAFAGVWVLNRQDDHGTPYISSVNQPVSNQPEDIGSESPVVVYEQRSGRTGHGIEGGLSTVEETVQYTYQQPIRGRMNEERPVITSLTSPEIDTRIQVALPEFTLSSNRIAAFHNEPKVKQSVTLENHVLAQDHQNLTVKGTEVNGQNKHFRMSEKFSLGLVVSPSTTDQRMNFGGGVLLSYNIGKRLSIRTGAAFHQYEVGILKDPTQPGAMEVAKTSDRPLQAEVAFAENNTYMMGRVPLIPNVNAVTGNVQTIDIPIEAKYSIYKGLYAGAGVSYAAVLNQKRYAHYVENVHVDPYAKGLPANEAEMKAAVQPVTRTIESAGNNVNTSGFGGFINMSLGKEMKMGKAVSLSVEPFVKLPVGNFRQADMNYTNGGIRIITNF